MKMPDTGVPMLRLECRCFFYFRLILCKQYSSNTKTKAIYTKGIVRDKKIKKENEIMSNFNANEQDQKKAESIRRQYISREDNKMEQLQKLDNKVKAPGKVIAGILGVIGALGMGAGMALVMVWGNMTMGLSLSIPGMIVALLAIPAYTLITASRKKKYSSEIMRLSDSLMHQ